jgi:hypothetical protein
MKTTRTMLVAAALSFTTAAAVFAANPHLGTWKFNESKSKPAPGMGKNDTVTYTEAKGGMIKLTADGVDKDGKQTHWTWEGKFDGKPYKVEGTPMMDTIAYKMMNDHTNGLTAMKDGKVAMTGTITVAKDGKSRVVTTTRIDENGKKVTSKSYYDKG